MWQRLSRPDVLVFLQVSFAEASRRRALNWNEAEYMEQIHRLRHAYQHADLVIDTNDLSPGQVLEQVVGFIQDRL
jgi:hypothetical protein